MTKMGSKKEKKPKKEKKEKKEKKKKRQKVDHDDAKDGINETAIKDVIETQEDFVDGLPPTFYENSEDKKVAKEQPTSQTDDGVGDKNDDDKETHAAKVDTNAAEEEGGTKKKRRRKRKRKANNGDDDDNDNDNDEDGEQTGTAFDASALVQDTIFVEGIPYDKSPQDVREFFVDEHGIPTEDVLELRLPTWQDTGRLRGFGHIRFATSKSYDKALGLNRKYMGRRYLSIQPAKSSTGSSSGKSVENPSIECPEGCVTIFVNNLPYGATEDQIAAAFSKHAPNSSIVEDGVRIVRNSVTRESKGFAYIEFESSKDAHKLMKAAVKKNMLVGGRIVRLDYDTGRIKGSFRTESGKLLNKNHED